MTAQESRDAFWRAWYAANELKAVATAFDMFTRRKGVRNNEDARSVQLVTELLRDSESAVAILRELMAGLV